jgi:hypothetical protein
MLLAGLVRRIAFGGRNVSFQITILKVLDGHPEGTACVADITRFVSVLMSSGSDWTDRMKRLAALAPQLDIFGSAYVVREDRGWQITDIGRQFLVSLEAQARAENCQEQQFEVNVVETVTTVVPLPPVLRLVVDNERNSQSHPVSGQTRRFA